MILLWRKKIIKICTYNKIKIIYDFTQVSDHQDNFKTFWRKFFFGSRENMEFLYACLKYKKGLFELNQLFHFYGNFSTVGQFTSWLRVAVDNYPPRVPPFEDGDSNGVDSGQENNYFGMSNFHSYLRLLSVASKIMFAIFYLCKFE